MERFLQGPDTALAAVGRIRRAIAVGEECREVLLDVRAEGSSWWNECSLTDATGAVVQYIGIQTDSPARVQAGPAGWVVQSSTDSPGASRA